MFGLTKREQRWKAEQKAAEVLVGLAEAVVRANADVRIAEANAELERLRKENAELRAARGVDTCCGNPAQCWEPCGELGKSEEHAAPAGPEAEARLKAAFGVKTVDGGQR